MDITKTRFSRKNDKNITISEGLLLLYVFECVIGGSGRWLEIGSLSIRMILFVLAFFATFPKVFRNWKYLTKNLQIIATVVFGVWLIICAVVGYLAENKFGFIISDITTFISLSLFPGFLVTMGNKKSIGRLLKVVFCASVTLSVITIGMHFCLAKWDGNTINVINGYMNEHSLGGMAALNTGMYRVYMRSQIFVQIALIYGIWLIHNETAINRGVAYVCEGIQLFALILSYTRGFWLGFAVSAGVLLVLEIKSWKLFMRVLAASLVCALLFVGVSGLLYSGPKVLVEVVNRFDPSLIVLSGNSKATEVSESEATVQTEATDPSESNSSQETNIHTEVSIINEGAANLRRESLRLMCQRILDAPLLGNGLGANLDGLRTDGRTEYMYLDVLMKTGFIGLALYLLTFFGYVAWCSFRRVKDIVCNHTADTMLGSIVIAAYVGITVTSAFNPFLNNPMGITVLMITITALMVGQHDSLMSDP